MFIVLFFWALLPCMLWLPCMYIKKLLKIIEGGYMKTFLPPYLNRIANHKNINYSVIVLFIVQNSRIMYF